ncbi:MAG TPA: methyltransferase domain-containing protein [Bdellovibrionota bacterium]|jgi:cyclopropane fatty-acyl-phospholipid synthase-like methyltransferase
MSTYFEKAASTYAQRSGAAWGAWSFMRRKESEAVFALLDLPNASHLLDIGCGAGFYMEGALKLFPSLSMEGCDRSAAMVEAARARGLPATISDFLEFTPAKKANRIVSAGMLEFGDEIGLFFAKANQWLSLDGRIVILVPKPGVLGRVYHEFHRRRGNEVRLRTPADCEEAARNAGFVLRESRSVLSFCWALSFAKESH